MRGVQSSSVLSASERESGAPAVRNDGGERGAHARGRGEVSGSGLGVRRSSQSAAPELGVFLGDHGD